jgi:hypothetical protein
MAMPRTDTWRHWRPRYATTARNPPWYLSGAVPEAQVPDEARNAAAGTTNKALMTYHRVPRRFRKWRDVALRRKLHARRYGCTECGHSPAGATSDYVESACTSATSAAPSNATPQIADGRTHRLFRLYQNFQWPEMCHRAKPRYW